MALSHKEAVKRKKAAIEEIKDKMGRAKIAIVTDYRGETKGMTVKAISELRKNLWEKKGEYHIYKNTLCSIALKEMCSAEFLEYFNQPTAVVFGFEDPASTSKVLVEFLKTQKEKQLPVIKAGYMDGKIYNVDQIKTLATLPSRDEMLAQLLRTMNATAQGLVTVLSGVPRALVNVMTRIKEQKEQGVPVEQAEQTEPAEQEELAVQA